MEIRTNAFPATQLRLFSNEKITSIQAFLERNTTLNVFGFAKIESNANQLCIFCKIKINSFHEEKKINTQTSKWNICFELCIYYFDKLPRPIVFSWFLFALFVSRLFLLVMRIYRNIKWNDKCFDDKTKMIPLNCSVVGIEFVSVQNILQLMHWH